jgi:hypothetical protein
VAASCHTAVVIGAAAAAAAAAVAAGVGAVAGCVEVCLHLGAAVLPCSMAAAAAV